MAIREAEPVASLNEVREAGLDREDLLQIYRNMVITRGIEERGHILYRQGKIPGSFYTGRGNEAATGFGLDPRSFYEAGVAGALCDEETKEKLRRIGESYDWGR